MKGRQSTQTKETACTKAQEAPKRTRQKNTWRRKVRDKKKLTGGGGGVDNSGTTRDPMSHIKKFKSRSPGCH